MGRWLLALPPLMFLALAVVFYVGLNRADPDGLPSTLIGQNAPALVGPPVSGAPALGPSLTEGEVTLVNFWASWCPPCRAEHPRLLKMSEDGVRIVGVNFNDRADDAAGYLAEDGNPFNATVFDERGRQSINWGVIAPPETFIVAADGTVLFRYTGPLVGSDFRQRFVPALAAAGVSISE